MPFELVYTSAPRTLRPGSTGFGPVAQTDGIPGPLAEQLELLSGYRHQPGDGGSPVVVAHTVLTVGRRTYHVLSRVLDAGFDHTNRTNHLAHHVAFTAEEAPPEGPAWLCRQWRFEDKWDGPPRKLALRALPGGRVKPHRCDAWEAAAGDAGWAGALAAAARAGEPAFLVYPPGLDVLPLLEEALGLLTTEERWAVTFNTYYTDAARATDYRWRCAPAGSTEARAAVSAGRGFVLRLDRSPPAAVPLTGPLVDAARTGGAPPPPPREAPRPTSTSGMTPAHRTPHEPDRVSVPASFSVAELPPAEPRRPAPPPPPARRPAPAVAPLPPPPAGFGVRAVLLGAAFGLAVALLGAAIFELATDRRVVLVRSKSEVTATKDLDETRQQLADMKAEKDRLAAALVGSKGELAKSATEFRTKSKDYEQAEIVRARLQKQTDDLNGRVTDLTGQVTTLAQANAALTGEKNSAESALKQERHARGEETKRLTDELKKATDGTKVALDKEREAFKKERERLEQAGKEKDKEREKLAADAQAKGGEVTKLAGEKAAAERERDDARRQLAAIAPAVVPATPLKVDFAPGKPGGADLPAPLLDVLPPPGFEPKADGGQQPGRRDYTYKGPAGAVPASVTVERHRLVVDGPRELAGALVRVRATDAHPPAYFQLLTPEPIAADKWPAEKPAVADKALRFEFALGKLADANPAPLVKEVVSAARVAELVPVPGTKVAVSVNGTRAELQPRADGLTVFETPAGQVPSVRLEVAGGKVVVTVAGGAPAGAPPPDARCQVVALELGRKVPWPGGGAAAVQRVAVVSEPAPPKK